MWNPTPLSTASPSDNKQNTKEVVAIDDCKCSGGVEELGQVQQQIKCKLETLSTFGGQFPGSNKIPQHQKDGLDKVGDDNKKISNSAEETTDSGFISGPQTSFSAILDADTEAAGKVIDDKKVNITEPSNGSQLHYKTQQQQPDLDSGIIEEDDDVKSDLDEEKNQSNEQKMILPHSVDSGISEWFCNLSLQNNPNLVNTTSTNAASGINNLNAPKQQQSFEQQTKTSYTGTIPKIITPVNAWEKYYQQNDDGDTHLHLACISGYEDVVAALIRMAPHPCLFNIQNDDAQTPLHLATLTAQPRIIRMLLIAGAKPTVRDRHGNTALHLACISGEEQCVRALTIPISGSEIIEAHRLHRFNDRVHLKYAQLPSDLEIRNYDGERCVHLAAQAGFINILRILVIYGADINAREGKSGLTPLHIAIERCNEELVNYILDDCQKLDIEMETYAGLTAYQVACMLNKSQIQNILEKRGAEPLTPPDTDYDSSDNELDIEDSKSYDRFGDPNYFVGYGAGNNAMTVA